MAQCDLTYKLANRSLKYVFNSLPSELSREKQSEIVLKYLIDLQFDNSKLYEKKIDFDDASYLQFVNRAKTSSFHKYMKGKNLTEEYPNIVGEIFSFFVPKQSRQPLGQFFTPYQEANRIAEVVKKYIHDIGSVVDYCAGVGSLVLPFRNSAIYVNDLDWVMPFLDTNMKLNGVKLNRSNHYDKYDLCLLNPPFTDKDTLSFLELATNCSNLVLIMPEGFEFSRNYKKSFAYFDENFQILAQEKLSVDAFAWFETKINSNFYVCKKR